MNPKDTSNEEILEDFEMSKQTTNVDDFIKELEMKEKSLDISSDLVIEVGDSEVEHDNIHHSFVANNDEFIVEPAPIKPKVKAQANDKANSLLKEKVEKAIKEKGELSESVQRIQKDFSNYRNRVERERKETFTNILSSLAMKILPVLDNMDRALDSTNEAEESEAGKDFQTFVEGIALVNQQLNEVLMEMGVRPILAEGEEFDPEYHEAVATVETEEVPHQTVVQELLRGYKIDDRIIRASMVKVSSSTQSNPSKIIEQNGDEK